MSARFIARRLWIFESMLSILAIRYRVGSMPLPVRLEIYDVRGHLVRALVRTPLEAGVRVHFWDRLDATGLPVSRGVYLVQLRAGVTTLSSKLVMLRHR